MKRKEKSECPFNVAEQRSADNSYKCGQFLNSFWVFLEYLDHISVYYRVQMLYACPDPLQI